MNGIALQIEQSIFCLLAVAYKLLATYRWDTSIPPRQRGRYEEFQGGPFLFATQLYLGLFI